MVASRQQTPDPSWLNKTQMAASLGISVQAFDKWGVQPVSRIGRRAHFHVRRVLDNRMANAAAQANPGDREAQADHRRQEAARRGLARKLEAAETRHGAIRRAYRQALATLRWADLESAEAELLAQVNALAEPLRKMAAIHADLESAEPGSSYGFARLEVKLPHLYHHAETGPVEIRG